jgi:hypothetical protein
MSRWWALVSVAALLLASGCLGSFSAHTQSRNGPSEVIGGLHLHRPYAEFRVRGIYSSCPDGTNHFGGELCRAHAEFTCLSKKAYMEAGNVLPNENLCLAILDLRTQPLPTGAGIAPVAWGCPDRRSTWTFAGQSSANGSTNTSLPVAVG